MKGARFLLIIGMAVILSAGTVYGASAAYASENAENKVTVATQNEVDTAVYKAGDMFGNKKVASCDYAYNLDGSADYITVEFEDDGYAIFARDTLEMMEYSLSGKSPFAETEDKKYYAGPANYLTKENNAFKNIETGEVAEISAAEATKFSKQTRSQLKASSSAKLSYADLEIDKNRIDSILSSSALDSGAPQYDRDNLILAADYGTFINNKQYFYSKPTHGNNYDGEIYGNGNSGTCGAIAAQLLLSYNNYCVDRRIIPDRFLNGYDDATNSVKYPEQNPNYCNNPALMNSYTTGTRSEGSGANSFYNEMITRIMPPYTSSSTIYQVRDGINSYLNGISSFNNFSLYCELNKNWFNTWVVDSEKIKSEIDASRPLIISLSADLGADNHMVVGYGYQDYYSDNSEQYYSGYVVHFGWQNKNKIWVNSSWCKGYLTLNIDHTHNYEYDRGTINGSYNLPSKCVECGHRTDAYVKVDRNSRLTECLASWQYFYKDFIVKFEDYGYQLFQTFGNSNTAILLYDEDKNTLLTYSRLGGYGENALLGYEVSPYKTYRVRIECLDKSSGVVKLAIAPSDKVVNSYSYIDSLAEGGSYEWIVHVDQVRLLCFTPSSSGTYRFNMFTTTGSDTYLYLINPNTTIEGFYNDDGGGDSQAMIETELIAGRRYLLIGCTFDITYEREDEGTEDIGIRVSKIS